MPVDAVKLGITPNNLSMYKKEGFFLVDYINMSMNSNCNCRDDTSLVFNN